MEFSVRKGKECGKFIMKIQKFGNYLTIFLKVLSIWGISQVKNDINFTLSETVSKRIDDSTKGMNLKKNPCKKSLKRYRK